MEQYQVLAYDEDSLMDVMEALADNLGSQTLSAWDLQRVTVPSQGFEMWSVPTAPDEKTEYQTSIEGIIIHTSTPRAYWSKKPEESGRTPPECSSPDGITGTPLGDCITCIHNQWGSDPDGAGKACREQRLLFMLRPGSFLPIVVQVPPTSIDAIKKYAVNVATRHGKPQWKVITSLKLTKIPAEPFPYSRIIPSVVDNVPEEYIPRLSMFRDKIRPLFGAESFVPLPASTDQQQAQVNTGEVKRKAADLYTTGTIPQGDAPPPGQIIEHQPVTSDDVQNIQDLQNLQDLQAPNEQIPDPFG